jgi:hypothetical protein
VIARRLGKDIAKEPKMKELKAVFNQMDDVEKARTTDYLTGALPPGKSEDMPGENRKERRTGHENGSTEAGKGAEKDFGSGSS